MPSTSLSEISPPDPLFVAIGLAAIVVGLAVHVLQRRRVRDAPVPI